MKLTYTFLGLVSVFLLISVLSIQAQTLLYLTGGAGSIAHSTQTISSTNGYVSNVSINGQNGVSFTLNTPSFSSSWGLDLSSATLTLLQPGLYLNATRYPFNVDNSPSPNTNGLNFDGNGEGNNTLTGEFVVLQALYSGNTLTSFAADFIQNDTGNPVGVDYGSIRYNSSVPLDVETGGKYTLVPEPTIAELFVLAIPLLFGFRLIRRFTC
jgi:hypothetical protein